MAVNYLASFCLGVILYNFTDSFYAAIPAVILIFLIICRLRAADITFLKIFLYAICVVTGIAYNFLYEAQIDKNYAKYDSYEVGCKALVKSEPYFSGSYTSFRAKLYFDDVKADAYVSISGENQVHFEYGNTVYLDNAVISPVENLNSGTNFNLKDYSYSHKLYLRAEAKDKNIIKVETTHGFSEFFGKLRSNVNKRLRYFFNGNILALVTGMITGDTTSAKEDFDAVMSGMGITHVVVVSGSHFAIVLLLISRFLQLFLADRKFIAPISVVVSFLLGAFFGFSASVIRSAAVVCIYCVCDIAGKERHTPVSAMFITLFAMFLYNPCVINDIALQLSFGSVAGITLFSKKIKSQLGYIPEFLSETVSVSLAANIFTIPVIAACFGKVSLMFLVGNIIITPFVPIIMFGGIILCIISTLYMKAATVIAVPLRYFCSGLFDIFQLIFSNVKSEIQLFPLSCFDLYLYFIALMLFTGRKHFISYSTAAIIIFCIGFGSFYNVPAYITKTYEFIKPDFYDNGRTVITTPEGKTIFVDMSNTVPGKRQIDNKIVSLLNAKSRGVIDYYVIMGERQLDLLSKIENKVKIKTLCCYDAYENEVPISVKQIKTIKEKSEIKIEDFVLTIVPDKDYNITKADCMVYGFRIGILRNATDVEASYDYFLPTVYAYNSLKKNNSEMLKSAVIKTKDKRIATLKIRPGKVMIN